MRNLIVSLFMLLSAASLNADILGGIEYQLPKESGKEWIVGNKLESEQGTTIIYIPTDLAEKNALEFFGVNANHMKIDINDVALIESDMKKVFPGKELSFSVISKADDSVLYEWSVKENSQEIIHGFGRAFATKDGTVVLGYQAEKIQDLAKVKAEWLPILQGAKPVAVLQ